jgi:malonyl-CoA O-methyltransferase
MIPPGRKAAVAAAFGQAAADYESAAGLQHQVARGLAERVAALALPPRPHILEIGCGTGFLTRALDPRLEGAHWLVTDLAPPMVARCRAHLAETAAGPARFRFAAMDGERPALAAAAGFDLIVSSLALQWFGDPARTLAAWADLLAPGGWLAWSTLAEGSFAEWRRAHAEAGLEHSIPDYPAAAAMTAWWPRNGGGSIETERLGRAYADGHGFLTELKRIGAHLPAEGRRPLSPGALRRLLRGFAAPAGLTVSYEIAYGRFRRGI